jgi:predicted MFS family arabinose efflux permease
MNKSERLILLLLASINFTHILDFMIMMPLGSSLMELLHIGPAEFSYLVSSYTFAAGVASFLASFVVDLFDRKKVLIFGYAGFLAGTLACGIVSDYHALLLARMIAGGFGGLIGAQVQSIVADTFSYERRAQAMGTLTAAFSLASVAGVPLGLFLAAQFNWHFPFLLIAGLGTMVIPLVLLFIPRMNGHLVPGARLAPSFAPFRSIAEKPMQKRALMLTSVLMVAHFSIIPFIAPSMELNVGLSKQQVTLMYFFGGLLTMFTAPLIGRMADRFGKHRVFYVLSVVALIPILFISSMGPLRPLALVFIITSSFFVFGGGRMIPAMALVSGTVDPKTRGSFMTLNSCLQQLATGFAALLAGRLIHKGPGGRLEDYLLVGLVAVAATLVCSFLASRIKVQATPLPRA